MTTILLLTIVGALAVTALTHRWLAQPGLVVVVVAGAISFVPGVPRLELEPELILGLVMPPLLYSATVQFSVFSFVRHLRAILALGVGLVVVTTLAVGGLTALVAPGVGVGAAFVLGAIVSPPDTVTVVTRGREMGLPGRVTAILTGESLVNDATALTIITITVTQVTGEHALFDNALGLFAYGVAVGAVVGVVLGFFATLVRMRLRDATLENALGLLVPFAAFLVAEHLHASGVVAVVVAGFSVSVNAHFDERTQTSPTAYRTRLQERQLWPVVDALLEAFVFAYMGLQLRFIIEDLGGAEVRVGQAVLLALAVLVTVVAVRFAWVFAVFGRWRVKLRWHARAYERDGRYRAAVDRRNEARRARRKGRPVREREVIGWSEMVLVSWTGMRGIVTLAAAAAIPATAAGGEPFPGRETIQVVAFLVAVGTLLLQGATLPWLARRLDIDLAEELRVEAGELAAGRAILDGFDVRAFDERRRAIRAAVGAGELDDVVGRDLLAGIDLDQAAFATRD